MPGSGRVADASQELTIHTSKLVCLPCNVGIGPVVREGRVLVQPPQPQAALQGSAQVLRLVMLLPPLRQRLAHLQPVGLQRPSS